MLVFDGETDQLLTAGLRRGTVHAGHGIVSMLKRIGRAVRDRWPDVTPEPRADCGVAMPALSADCDAENIGSTIGLPTNPRLTEKAASLQAEAERRLAANDHTKVRLFGESTYQAETWPNARRVVITAEMREKGLNIRFVVTTRDDTPEDLYAWYIERGASENWIEDLKRGCFADRLSGHRFWANQCRLILHAAAYWRRDTLRRWLTAAKIPRMTLEPLRLRLTTSHPNEGWWRPSRPPTTLHE